MRSAISWFLRSWEGIGLFFLPAARVDGGGGDALCGIPASESFIYVALLTPASLAMLPDTGRDRGAATTALEVSVLALGEGNAVIQSQLATLGAALALMGPGAWSVDARLSGWRRI